MFPCLGMNAGGTGSCPPDRQCAFRIPLPQDWGFPSLCGNLCRTFFMKEAILCSTSTPFPKAIGGTR